MDKVFISAKESWRHHVYGLFLNLSVYTILYVYVFCISVLYVCVAAWDSHDQVTSGMWIYWTDEIKWLDFGCIPSRGQGQGFAFTMYYYAYTVKKKSSFVLRAFQALRHSLFILKERFVGVREILINITGFEINLLAPVCGHAQFV